MFRMHGCLAACGVIVDDKGALVGALSDFTCAPAVWISGRALMRRLLWVDFAHTSEAFKGFSFAGVSKEHLSGR